MRKYLIALLVIASLVLPGAVSAQVGGEGIYGISSSENLTFGGLTLSNLTSGYLPYAAATTKLLTNSPIYTDGTNVNIGGTNFPATFSVLRTVNDLGGGTTTVVDFGVSQLGFPLSTNGGVRINLRAAGSNGTYYNLGAITAQVGSIVNNGYLGLHTLTSGSLTEKLRIDELGNVGVGTTTFGTSAAKVLGIGEGTAPTTSPADMVQLWAEAVAGSSELKVRDEAGNVTTLSPHNFTLFQPDKSYSFPWSYYSKNDYIGKEINVDMYGAIAEIEKLSGKKFIFVNDIPKSDYYVHQEKIKTERDEEIKKQNDQIADLNNKLAALTAKMATMTDVEKKEAKKEKEEHLKNKENIKPLKVYKMKKAPQWLEDRISKN